MQISWTRSVWMFSIFNISLIGRVDARQRASTRAVWTGLKAFSGFCDSVIVCASLTVVCVCLSRPLRPKQLKVQSPNRRELFTLSSVHPLVSQAFILTLSVVLKFWTNRNVLRFEAYQLRSFKTLVSTLCRTHRVTPTEHRCLMDARLASSRSSSSWAN